MNGLAWCFLRLASVATFLLFGCATSPTGQPQTAFQYFYDSAGRLTKAVDSTGVAIQWVYDAAGNITQINRATVGSFALLNFTPQQGTAGARITIQGTGFSTTPAANTVKFNGTAAVVLSSTATSIVAIVPTGATSGTISVQVGSNTVTSSDSFTVQASTPQNTPPVVTIVSPAPGASLLSGQAITLASTVTTANTITSLDYSINGVYMITGVQSSTSTFSRTFTIPYGVTALTIGARAFDNQANVGFAAPVSVTVSPGGTTTVSGTTTNTISQALVGASVAVLQNGLKAEYFWTSVPSQLSAIPALGAADQTKVVPNLDFLNPAGTGGPLFGNDTFGLGGPTNFAARFTGTLTVPAAGSYTFTLGASAGAQLLVNGTLVATFHSTGQFGQSLATVTLGAGPVPIEVDYLNLNSQVPQLQLSWSSPMKAVGQRQVIAQGSLQMSSGVFTATSGTGGAYSIPGVPVSVGQLWVQGGYQTKSGSVGYFAPVAGGTTNAGAMIIGVFLMQSLDVGGFDSCGIAIGGAGYCWGFNGGAGPLGIGFVGGQFATQPGWGMPKAVVAPAGGSVLSFTSIRAGRGSFGGSTCGTTSGGASYCWGSNTYGQLGNGTNGDSSVPVAVSSAMGSEFFTQLSVGGLYACGTTGSGRTYCWGVGDQDDLGTGNAGSANTPQPVQGGLSFSLVLSGWGTTSLGLTASGTAYHWGGDGFVGVYPQPTMLQGPAGQGPLTFTSLTQGNNFSCGVTTDSTGYCWSNSGLPVAVPAPAGGAPLLFRSISAGRTHKCGITTDGATYCWGDNSYGQSGTGNTTSSDTPVLVQAPAGVPSAVSFVYVGAGYAHTCGMTPFGVAYCWGDNSVGQLGVGIIRTACCRWW